MDRKALALFGTGDEGAARGPLGRAFMRGVSSA
jgi:hypothetical protein